MHIPNRSFFALADGLFSDNYETKSFQSLGFYAHDDFYTFGIRIGIMGNRVREIMNKYLKTNQKVIGLTRRSFLTPPIKEQYTGQYQMRLRMLNTTGHLDEMGM